MEKSLHFISCRYSTGIYENKLPNKYGNSWNNLMFSNSQNTVYNLANNSYCENDKFNIDTNFHKNTIFE